MNSQWDISSNFGKICFQSSGYTQQQVNLLIYVLNLRLKKIDLFSSEEVKRCQDESGNYILQNWKKKKKGMLRIDCERLSTIIGLIKNERLARKYSIEYYTKRSLISFYRTITIVKIYLKKKNLNRYLKVPT